MKIIHKGINNRRILFLFFIIISFNGLGQNNQQKIFSYSKFFSLVLQEDMKTAIKFLNDSYDGLDDSQKVFKSSIELRMSNNEEYKFKTDNDSIKILTSLFHDYWKSILLKDLTVRKADKDLMKNLGLFFDLKKSQVSSAIIDQNLQAFVKDQGFYVHSFGKTGSLFDLFLWKKQDQKTYEINLIDDTVNVTVYFMDKFISQGWAHFATLGNRYASNFSTDKALFCTPTAYDTLSENYKVSYLAHEGQHFSDLNKYPYLDQTLLEYRAKLVELAKSKATTHGLIRKFFNHSNSLPGNAHAHANYLVIKDLSEMLFEVSFKKSFQAWEELDQTRISNAAEQLYTKNTEKL